MGRKDLILSLGGEHVVHLFILYSNEQINNNRAPLVSTYQVKQGMGHSSVTTTEIYAKFSLRRLEMDFPSLVKSNNSRENRKLGHGLVGHKPSTTPLNTTLIGS